MKVINIGQYYQLFKENKMEINFENNSINTINNSQINASYAHTNGNVLLLTANNLTENEMADFLSSIKVKQYKVV